MAVSSESKLSRLYNFFNSYGTERLSGLDRSYFVELSPEEKEEAWKFLMVGFPDSVDNIIGLYLLDKDRAIEEFKSALSVEPVKSDFPAERRASEINRLLMLRYVTNAEPTPQFLDLMEEYARSEFEEVRSQFAQSVSLRNATPGIVQALKGMIYTESERIPLATAIMALMELHGLNYDVENPIHRAIYMSLRSNSLDEKNAGMNRLDAIQPSSVG